MKKRFSFGKKFGLIASILMLQSVVNAQVLWNLKVGGMLGNMEDWNMETKKKVNWMAGLELEVPIKYSWSIETGLRYKSKPINYDGINNDGDYIAYHFENADLIELPVRATYKHQLNNKLSLHLGVGPYISYFFDGASEAESKFQVGIEPSFSLLYKNLNVGLSYVNPVLYKGYKDDNNNLVMVTLGFRFGNKVWKSIGNAMEKAADSGALDALGNALQNTANALGGNSRVPAGTYTTPSSSSSSSSSYSSSTNGNKYNMSEQQSYNTAKKSYKRCDDNLSNHFYGGRPATGNEVKQWQQEMKRLREMWTAKGKSFPHSSNETHSTASCPSNKSHSH